MRANFGAVSATLAELWTILRSCGNAAQPIQRGLSAEGAAAQATVGRRRRGVTS